MAGAAPHRRLIERGHEALRRHRREYPDIAGPGNAEKVAAGTAHARNLGMPSKTFERPIQRANKPRYALLLARSRGTAPLIRRVEHPNAGKVQDVRYRRNFGEIRRTRSLQSAMRKAIERRDQWQRRMREKLQAGVAQCSSLRGPQLRMPQWTTLTHVDDRNARQCGCHLKRPIRLVPGVHVPGTLPRQEPSACRLQRLDLDSMVDSVSRTALKAEQAAAVAKARKLWKQ